MIRPTLMGLALCALALGCQGGCQGGRTEQPRLVRPVRGGDPQQGAQVISDAGCGACHTIPGIRRAEGKVAPPLSFFSQRTFIAGRIPNTAENLTLWVMNPHGVDPHTAMPDLGLSEQQARDVAAYLYTLE